MSCVRKLVVTALIVAVPLPALAALPPQYQNLNDLNVMVAFIEQHDKVAAELRRIDLDTYTIHFGEACEAHFKRGESQSEIAGPAADLEYHSATCAIDY